MTLVSTEWLNNNLSKVKIFDASWHMPNSNRNGHKEYLDKHIPGAMFMNGLIEPATTLQSFISDSGTSEMGIDRRLLPTIFL